MNQQLNRRSFFTRAGAVAGLAATPLAGGSALAQSRMQFRISLAEWSLHKAIQSRLISNLDFPRLAREHFGIEGLEFVNALWEAPTEAYVNRLKANMKSTGTTGVLIMVDGEGSMGHRDKQVRIKAADNHRKWVDIAAELGCHSIRTNAATGGKQPSTPAEIDEFIKNCIDSFSRLCEYAQSRKINVIIENHGGISSNPDVLVKLMQAAKISNFGVLPDFGNFPKELDRYEAVKKLMPYAKGASMKCYDFTPEAKETTIDMERMLKVVTDSGYHSWVGIEYEGSRLPEYEGVLAAKRCLSKILSA